MVKVQITGRPGCAELLSRVNGVKEVYPDGRGTNTYIGEVTDFQEVVKELEMLRKDGYHFVIDTIWTPFTGRPKNV